MKKGHDGKIESDNLVPKYKGIVDGIRTIYKTEGVMGLYKGFHISILSQAASTALFFWM